jgi:hypothetical protein
MQTTVQTISVGDRVRSYDFAHRFDCFVEGTVEQIDEVAGRYAIRVEREVFDSEPMTDGRLVGRLVYPPLNGLPQLFADGPTNFVHLIA